MADQERDSYNYQQPGSASATIVVRDLETYDQSWMHDFLVTYNHSLRVVSRGTLHHVPQLPGLIATYNDIPSALLTYHLADQEFEVVTLHAAVQGHGLGAQLLAVARARAHALDCSRLWLITTNDNLNALGFYQRRGFRLVAG